MSQTGEEPVDARFEKLRESYLLKMAQEKSRRLEAENEALRVHNQLLESRYSSQRSTQADIMRTLHENLEEAMRKLEEAEATKKSLEDELTETRSSNKDAMENQRQVWQVKVDELTLRNKEMSRNLEAVKEFMDKQHEFEDQLQTLRDELVEKQSDHDREISALHRKKAVEIDQLKKDMLQKIRETRESLRQKTKEQLDMTTKRTIIENEQMATELHYQSRETERLLARQRTLEADNARLQREMNLHREVEEELARRTSVHQRLIKSLHARLKKQIEMQKLMQAEAVAAAGAHAPGKATESAADAVNVLQGATEEEAHILRIAREEAKPPRRPPRGRREEDEAVIEALKAEVKELQEILKANRSDFEKYKEDHATLAQLQNAGVRVVIAALYDLKNRHDKSGGLAFDPVGQGERPGPAGTNFTESAPELSRVGPNAVPSPDFTELSPERREVFLRLLLDKIFQSVCSSCASAGQAPRGSEGLHHVDSANFASVLFELSRPEAPAQSSLSTFLPSREEVTHLLAAKASKAIQTDAPPKDFSLDLQSISTSLQQSSFEKPSLLLGGVREWGEPAQTLASKRGTVKRLKLNAIVPLR